MYDYIIVGAGSAGCVLANRLSADPANRVLLLEAGADARPRESSIPAAWSKLFRSAHDWAYETEPNPGLGGRRLFVPRGRVLGGSSALNAMVYVRGNRADYDGWAAAGNDGWSHDEVLPYFKRSERNSRGATEYHGSDGPLCVSDIRTPNPLSTAFVAAAAAAGIPRNDDCNGAEQDGVGFLQATIDRGQRCSAADAFVRPIRARRNLHVLTGAVATRILFEGRRAVGVRYRVGNAELDVHAGREVVLSCGAFDSPKLLLLSGIGPAADIRRFGLDVVHDLPGVGRNLQEHPTIGLRVRCRKPLSLLSAESPGNILRYLLLRRGMLASNGAEAAAFVRTRPDLPAPDIEILVIPVLWLNEGFTAPTEHGYTIPTVLLTPRSRGSVTLRSPDPRDPPVIDTNHFSDAGGDDLRTMIQGLTIARGIVAQPPLARLSGDELFPGRDVTGPDLADMVRGEAQTIWHPVGTCGMGPGASAVAVVDPSLRVRGVHGLRVVDASVLPVQVRGHTHAVTVMIAEKAADMILQHDAQAAAVVFATATG